MNYDPEAVNQVAGLIALATVVPLLVGTLVYGLGSAWWKSWLGRVIFTKWVTLVLVFAFVLTRRAFGNFPGYEWVSLGLFSLLFLAYTANTVVVIIERRAPWPDSPRSNNERESAND